jgi:hypothetical protein
MPYLYSLFPENTIKSGRLSVGTQYISSAAKLTASSTISALIEGTEILQPVQLLATGWTAEGTELESRKRQDFSLLHVVQTGS